jgi:hypothetical protein
MQTLNKLLSTLMVAFFMACAGVASAASDVSPVKPQVLAGADSGTTQQSPTPPDCKKDPKDPRCK